jgi:predicted MPP superfamily phosphohydrolase
MRSLYPVIFSIVLITLFGLLQVLFFRFFNKQFWDKKWLKYISWTLPLAGIIGVTLWGFGEYWTIDWLAYPGAITAVLIFIFEFCLILSLPVSGVVHFINWIWEKIFSSKEKPESPLDKNRRLFLRSTAAAIPLVALSAGGMGVARAMSDVNVCKKQIKFDNLPDNLTGMKILHLSDIHLRHYVTLNDLERILIKAEKHSPDMTLITGDIADDLKLLPDALKMVYGLNSSLGAYACLGNHEYFRGLNRVYKTFDESEIPLLVDKGITINKGNSSIFIGGLDDPRFMGAKDLSFFKTAIDKTIVDRPDVDFTILMSHRPDALDYASEKQVDLILAGHTHGGQIGFNRQSLFESYFPDRYLWGHYKLRQSHLYTSSGVGHWFPFRLGCPAEAPIIELVKS